MKRLLTLLGFWGCMAGACAQDAVSQNYPVNHANRADGREISTYAIVHEMLKQTAPRCAYKEGMSKTEFKEWQNRLSNAMADLMNFPEVKGQPAPKRISSEPRDGYTLEKCLF